METISLEKDKQKDLNKRVKKIKKGIKKGDIVIKENAKKDTRKKRKKPISKAHATIYLGHIPHGFYEDQMTSYFSQFGKVIRATVARSHKTGRSKGYGFVEFQDEDVAKIAAETMNNYLMYNRILKCRYIPPEERKGRIFVRTINPFDYPRKKNRLIDCQNKLNALKKLDKESYQKKTEQKIEGLKKFFEERGIDFTFKLNGENSDESGSKISSEDEESIDSETEDETDDQFDILEIDESDNEIQFITPPQVKKVIKKAADLPLTSSRGKKTSHKAAKKKEVPSQTSLKKSQKSGVLKEKIISKNSKLDLVEDSKPKGKKKLLKVKQNAEGGEEKLSKKPKIMKKSIKKSSKSKKSDALKKSAASLLKKTRKTLNNENCENLGVKKVKIEKIKRKTETSKSIKSKKPVSKQTPSKISRRSS